MNVGPSGVWSLIRQTFEEWSEDKAPQLGAALDFYTALSIAPLLVITLGIVAFFLGNEAAGGQITQQLGALLGEEGSNAIEDMIVSANKPTEGVVATMLSVITLLFGASGVFGQLQTALNTIWEVKPKPDRSIWGFLRDRFLSFTMVLGMAFLLPHVTHIQRSWKMAVEKRENTKNVKELRNEDPLSGEAGAHPVGAGVGAALGGAATGAAAGVVAGPIGAAIGTVLGGIAGGLAGKPSC